MPQQIDVPNVGRLEFPDGMSDADMSAAIEKNFGSQIRPPTSNQPQGPPDERPFLERATSKVGSFLRNVYENPPPSIAAARDIIKAAPGAATELTWGSDPEAARQAAGVTLPAAAMGLTLPPGPARMGAAAGAAQPRPAVAPPVAVTPTPRDTMLGAAERLNVDIPRYMATEGTALPQFAAGLKNVPLGGEPIVQSAQRLSERLGEVKREIAPSAASPEMAGEQAGTGISSWIKSGSQGPVSERYQAVDKLVDPNWGQPLENTANALHEILRVRANARIPGNSPAGELVLDAIRSPMDYEGLKTLRTAVGPKVPRELMGNTLAEREHKIIYGALTEDLKQLVLGGGGPEALAAWQEANALARLTSMRRTALAKVVGEKGDAAPEAVFSRLAAYAGSKSSADIGRLRLAKNAMGPQAWEEVSSALVNRMGMAPDGKFSPDRFVTAFGNMAPKAKDELFRSEQLAALNDLFTVSTHVQDRITRFGNPSGTGRVGVVGGILGGMYLEPISLISSMVGTRLAAQALSKPAVVRAANAVARTSLQGNPAAKQAALRYLAATMQRAGLPLVATTLPQARLPAPALENLPQNPPPR
jgi:hypothetical protein